MNFQVDIPEHLDKIFFKLKKRNPKQLMIICKKIKEIQINPHHYKPLRGDLKGTRRVHIDKSFVLTFEIDEGSKKVRLLDYDHHDNIY